MDNNDKRSYLQIFTSGEDKNVIISNLMSMKLNDKVTAAIIEYLLEIMYNNAKIKVKSE